MRNILLLTSILFLILFSGCASSNNFMTGNDVKFNIKKIENSDSLYKINYSKSGKYIHLYPLVTSTMYKTKIAVKKLGYKYFQIVAPAQISNLAGFPINSPKNLAAFINPQVSMPTEELNIFETKKTLLLNQNEQNIVSVPLTIFQETKFEFVIRVMNETNVEDIVWDTNIN